MAHSTKHHPSTRHHHPTTHTKAKGKRRPTKAKKTHQPTSQLTAVSATAAPSVTTASPMLFGDQTIESLVDNNTAGMAEAFPFTANTAGQALTLSVYVDSHNKATKLIAGVYSDTSGHPGSLLASGSASSPKSGAWDAIALPTTAITSGQSYWLAILGTGGASYFRDRDAGPCQSVTSAQTTLTSLPSAWKNGSTWQSCPVSMYVGGTPAKVVSSSDPGTTTTTGSSPLPPLPVPPINVLPPTVSGMTTQGQTLSATTGTWSDSSSSFTYAWQDCDSSGASCAAISGATGSSYALRASDVGHTLRAVVTATNAGGSGSATSNATSAVDPAPVTAPSNTGAPAVSGTATQGKTLATTNGSWNGSPTGYTYAWQDCNSSGASCSAITGATSSSYTLQASDVGHTIRSAVTASNSGGSATAGSAATAVVAATAAAPANTAAPSVSGTATQGSTLTTSNGSWSGSPTGYTYAWQDCDGTGANCATISGATASRYTLGAGDVGDTVRSVVTAKNAGGAASATSSTVGPIASGGGGTGDGLVPCPLTHAGGADPANSCWATHTGVFGSTGVTEAQIEANPAAVGFTKYNGDLTITQPNTVIDHMWINGCISIADGADNTVIKNSLVTSDGDACSGDDAGGSAINTGQGPYIAKNTLIEDVTVDGGKPGYGSHNAGITLDGGTALRVNLFGFAQGFISDSNTAQYPALFQDVYGHDYYGCSHDDGTWFNSSSYVTFKHGWIMTNDPTQPSDGEGCSTGALTGGSDYGPQDHVVFDDSYGEGVTGEDTHAGCGSTYSAYTNDALSNNAKDYGSGFGANNTGNSWANNYVAETGAAMSDPETRSGC